MKTGTIPAAKVLGRIADIQMESREEIVIPESIVEQHDQNYAAGRRNGARFCRSTATYRSKKRAERREAIPYVRTVVNTVAKIGKLVDKPLSEAGILIRRRSGFRY